MASTMAAVVFPLSITRANMYIAIIKKIWRTTIHTYCVCAYSPHLPPRLSPDGSDEKNCAKKGNGHSGNQPDTMLDHFSTFSGNGL